MTGTRAHWSHIAGRAILTLLLTALVILAAAAVVIPRIIGAVPLTVLSGSMEPALSVGDLVVVQEVDDPTTIAVGDVITFQPDPDSETLVTHRVVGLVLGVDTTGFITQGDANNVADDQIVADQVIGRVVYSLPLVGYLTGTEWGSIALTVSALGLVVYGLAQLVPPKRRDPADTAPSDREPTRRRRHAAAPEPAHEAADEETREVTNKVGRHAAYGPTHAAPAGTHDHRSASDREETSHA